MENKYTYLSAENTIGITERLIGLLLRFNLNITDIKQVSIALKNYFIIND